MDATPLDMLAARARGLLRPNARAVLGITGAPGSGKTTLAEELVDRLHQDGVRVAHVPMDGFHLADVTLRQLGLLGEKGSIRTFDDRGYLALLLRLRHDRDDPVHAPDFDRILEQPVAAAITVHPGNGLVITEGNYLLDTAGVWPEIRSALDEVWFVGIDDTVRRERLVRRHVQFGKSEGAAREWVDRVDEANARRIIQHRDDADLVVEGA